MNPMVTESFNEVHCVRYQCCDPTCCKDKENRATPLDVKLVEAVKNSIERSHPLDEAINGPFND